jgi:hypothetical protein
MLLLQLLLQVHAQQHPSATAGAAVSFPKLPAIRFALCA